ncbi:sugar ABC transporter permease [uncultured Eubacterium sp.]|jgi:oligogalacturonide transport system permease protein|uniref:carbohydrate ABC transporter permease n=1 Tax=Eubacterium sp. TaxID=142586 RepID=UPI003263DD46
MADENKIVTPSDIEEAKTETVDTQTTATVENTVAEKDEKVESVVTDEEIASVEITQPQKAQSSILRAQMKSLRDEEEEEEAKEKEEKSQPEEEPVRGDSIIEEKLAKIEKEEKMSKAEARAEKAALKAAEKAAKEEAKAVNKKETKQKKVQPKEKGKKKMQTYQHRQNKYGYAFMAPWIVGFLLFTLFPFVATIFLSFMNVKKAATGYVLKFSGINNYITAFIKNSDFLPALLSYLKMIIPYTFIVVVLSFIIAYLLNKIKTGKGLLRTIYFLPVIIMSGPVMSQLLDVQNAAAEATQKVSGAVDAADQYSNIFIMQMIQSYSAPLATTLAQVFDQLSIILWFTGIPIVLFINGLQKINVSIYEAAKIDSANAWQIMWKITIPMLRQIGMIITIFTVIQLGTYEAINPVYTLILEQTGDTASGLGYAATYAWIYSIIVLIIVGFVLLLFKERKPKDIKDRKRQEKKLAKLEKQQMKRLKKQNRYAKKEAKKYGK